MPDCTPTGERRTPNTEWKYVGAYPVKAELINNVFSNHTVYVWKRMIELEYLCECRDPKGSETVWIDGVEYYQFTLIGELNDVLRVGPIGAGVPAGLREAFDAVAADQGAYDPTLWWGPSARPYTKEAPVNVVAPEQGTPSNVTQKPPATVPVVDCAHATILMPDGKKRAFSPHIGDPGPVTALPPLVPWEERFDDCCKPLAPEARIPRVELIADESCIFKEGGSWYFNGHVRVTHPCGVGDVKVDEYLIIGTRHIPVSPPLHPGRGKERSSDPDARGITRQLDITWSKQNIAVRKPHGVLLVITATSRCNQPVFRGSFTITRVC